jgi:hypothetical protein
MKMEQLRSSTLELLNTHNDRSTHPGTFLSDSNCSTNGARKETNPGGRNGNQEFRGVAFMPVLTTPTEHFLRHAAECEQMARTTRDPQSKLVWRRMAERWTRCAELARQDYQSHSSAKSRPPHRKPAHAWAH